MQVLHDGCAIVAPFYSDSCAILAYFGVLEANDWYVGVVSVVYSMAVV